MKQRIIAGVILILAVVGIGGAALADNKDNDRVLRGDRMEFIEVFRQDDKNGDKNYQYTITEFEDTHGRLCTVTTADSEQTIALDCDWPQGR